MSGLNIRMRRLFQNGKAFVVALDHGLVMGPLKGIEDPIPLVEKLSNYPDALQMTPAMLKRVEENFYSRSSPMLIARLDTANVWRKEKKFSSGYYSLVYSVKDAVEAGADAVVTYLVVGYGEDEVEGYNIERISLARKEAHEYGIPFIVEPLYVVPENPDSVKDVQLVKYVTRLASEIGADILKVDYTGNKEGFKEVVNTAFSPILIRGGPKTNDDREFISMLKDALDVGSSGITVGRNLWQSKDPGKMARAISELVKGRIGVEEAVKML
ncbi:aldolase [Candidatus Acidianus copahuensis]|uniref:Aldolase n=1 Tax=Candidatus Acidianus copahuensis TaxID=1160895 RepID=A0A031LUN4_9CREN|nr:aldolase [Candidatus Acidianus copahuensis]EZQ10858.1 aldolase [Candidatus Acidianus copahuensis]